LAGFFFGYFTTEFSAVDSGEFNFYYYQTIL